MAMRWVAQAWEKVKVEATVKCFRKAGIFALQNGCLLGYEEDPFIDVDESVDLQGLINDVMPTNDSCSSQDYAVHRSMQRCIQRM